MDILSQSLVGEKHLKLRLRHHDVLVDGIWFNRTEPLPPRARLAFRAETDDWGGRRRVRFVVEGAQIPTAP